MSPLAEDGDGADREPHLDSRLILRDHHLRKALCRTDRRTQLDVDAGPSVRLRDDRVGLGLRTIELDYHGGTGHGAAAAVHDLDDDRLGKHLPHAPGLAVALNEDDGGGLALAGQDEIFAAAGGETHGQDGDEWLGMGRCLHGPTVGVERRTG